MIAEKTNGQDKSIQLTSETYNQETKESTPQLIVSTTAKPVKLTTLQMESNDSPVKSTILPVKSTTVPIQSTSLPVYSTAVPVKSTGLPIKSTTVPIKSTTVAMKSTTVPVKSTFKPIESTITTTEKSADLLPTPLQQQAEVKSSGKSLMKNQIFHL